MNTLDRYLYRTVLLYTLMAMGVLLTLGALFVLHIESIPASLFPCFPIGDVSLYYCYPIGE